MELSCALVPEIRKIYILSKEKRKKKKEEEEEEEVDESNPGLVFSSTPLFLKIIGKTEKR